MIIAVTGDFSRYTPINVRRKLKSMGYEISPAVTNKTALLFAGDNPGIKYKKALETGTPILRAGMYNFRGW